METLVQTRKDKLTAKLTRKTEQADAKAAERTALHAQLRIHGQMKSATIQDAQTRSALKD
jgi:hypothetical protein